MVVTRKLGHFSLQSELGELEEKLSKEVKAPFDGPLCAMCCFAFCLGALMAKRLPGMGKGHGSLGDRFPGTGWGTAATV